MQLQQYELKCGDLKLVTWLESGRCKIGDKVTLKDRQDSEALWEVVASWPAIIYHHDLKKVNAFKSIEARKTKKDL